MRLVPTPRLHGIHHSMVQQETDSNWSSGLTMWDWMHGTLRVDVPQDAVEIGVPAYRNPAELNLGAALALPFAAQRDAWTTADGTSIDRDPALRASKVFPS